MLGKVVARCRQNVSMVTVLRHYAGSTALPQTTVTEINRNVTLEQHSAPSDMPRPLAILLGWMFAKPTVLKKFTNIYLEQGFDVITVRIRVAQLLFPKRIQSLTRGIIDLCQQGDLQYQPLMSHGFSVGGYVYGELLHNLSKYPDKYASFRARLRAQVFDSPVDYYGIPTGLSRAITNNVKTQASIHNALEWYLDTFSDTVMKDYKQASKTFHANELDVPSIFFYSLSDPVIDSKLIEGLSLSWQNRGLESCTVFWEKAPHVSTYRKYPDQYKQSLLEFIWRSRVKGHNLVQDIAEDNDGAICRPLGLKLNIWS